jgi:KDO2-lipid IV(A) lauroyltransferase
MNTIAKILYSILTAVLVVIAHLPLRVLYVFADVLYLLIYYCVRYRRRLVRRNLTKCFPEKSEAEIIEIEKQFYHNFADYIVETVKLLHISDAEMQRRFTFTNLDAIKDFMEQGHSIVAYFSHCGNWEWTTSITLHCPEQIAVGNEFCQIYRPLRNVHFDNLMFRIRRRFGSVSIPKSLTLRRLLEMRNTKVTSITGFMSDQKPSHGDTVHVVNFLNRPTAVITGTETLARRLKMAVVYFDMQKLSRGHYNIVIQVVANDASRTQPFYVTDKYFSLLEQTIKNNPSIWLWTHNRWKNPIPGYEQSN